MTVKYVLDVHDPFDPTTGIGGHLTRHAYDVEMDALDAQERAEAAGFDTRLETVQPRSRSTSCDRAAV